MLDRERLYKYYPKTSGHVSHIELSTPLTSKHFINAPEVGIDQPQPSQHRKHNIREQLDDAKTLINQDQEVHESESYIAQEYEVQGSRTRAVSEEIKS